MSVSNDTNSNTAAAQDPLSGFTIDEVDAYLSDWIRERWGDIPVTLSAPEPGIQERQIRLYLYQIAPVRHARTHHTPLQIALHYLLLVYDETPKAAHALLDSLIFAVLEYPIFQVHQEPLSAQEWKAFGIPPRPCIRLELRIRRAHQTDASLVTRQPIVHMEQPRQLKGIVIGPDDYPIENAMVEVIGSDQLVYTDRHGHFLLKSLSRSSPVTLRIRARGREQAYLFDPEEHDESSITIQIDI